jgi:hypothetical protein
LALDEFVELSHKTTDCYREGESGVKVLIGRIPGEILVLSFFVPD